jgi:hypothetical protein
VALSFAFFVAKPLASTAGNHKPLPLSLHAFEVPCSITLANRIEQVSGKFEYRQSLKQSSTRASIVRLKFAGGRFVPSTAA